MPPLRFFYSKNWRKRWDLLSPSSRCASLPVSYGFIKATVLESGHIQSQSQKRQSLALI